jgi:uncharacterized protein YbjQ (UPF0145 family)
VPLFRRGPAPDPEAQAEQQASIDALVAGGLPLKARERLGGAGGPFTSTFSVDELALAHASGVTPLAQVMGSSVYHVGFQGMQRSFFQLPQSRELTVLSDSWNEARRLSYDRLTQEARLAGADAVVSLDQRVGAHDWMAGAIEYQVFGTAVRDGSGGEPVLTNLSLQDYRKLKLAGYRPAGLFGSSGVFYVVSGWSQQGAQMSWANRELPDFTRGVYDAREVVIERVSVAAQTAGADGLVGVWLSYDLREVETGNSGRRDLMVTMHVLGTGIVHDGVTQQLPEPRLGLDLAVSGRNDHILGGTQ